MLKGLLKTGTELEFTPVNTGDSVSLGDRRLQFLHTPYLHWPDTQCTYLEEEQLLFSGDAFGCHFCDARLFNDLVGDFRFSFEYYYAHIMRPFKQYVLTAVELVEQYPIRMIAPTHGPILRHNPLRYVQRYHELSSPRLHREVNQEEKTLLIFYISSYGNTARMAEAVYEGANTIQGIRVSLYDLAGGEVEPFVDLIEECDGIALGTPTINGDATKMMWDLLSSLVVVNLKGKFGAAFGSYGWSGEAVRMLEDRMRGLKMRVPLQGLRVKLIPTAQELEDCRHFGRQLAEFITNRNQAKVIDMANLA
jgi:flavorubredoxin